MQITVDTLKMQISRLKQLVAECPTPGENVELEIQHILQTAPKILQDAESSIQSGDQVVLEQVHEMLKETGGFIEWAVGSVKGDMYAEKVRCGAGIDATLPADKRLLDRLTRYMMSKIDGPTYLDRVMEFAGDDAVQGDTVHMDPTIEVEAFSQWFIHDIPLPGEKKTAIELFAQEESSKLPADEQALLELHLKDRPSIYKVIDSSQGPQGSGIQGGYTARDMLTEDDTIQIWDVATSMSLQKGAIFIGRAIPVDAKAENLFSLLGTVTELPQKLWDKLYDSITSWSAEYFAQNKSASSIDFFRACHARIWRKINEISGGYTPYKPKKSKPVKVSSMKLKTASDIDKYVKRILKKGGGDERLMQSPDLMKYMNKWKRLMDTSSTEEMDYLSNRFKGFHRFGKFLERFAMAIKNGDIEVP